MHINNSELHAKPSSTYKLKYSGPSNHEFFQMFQVDHFVDCLLQFLQAKRCSETLEFVMQVEEIKNAYLLFSDLPLIKLSLQQLFTTYIEHGSRFELNLSNSERTKLLDLYSKLSSYDSSVPQHVKHIKSNVRKLVKALEHQKQTLLLQLKEERYSEFKVSHYWDNFLCKINQPSATNDSKVNIDLSFRWITPAKQWSAIQVAQWLQSMGVEEYALFEEHEINGRTLQSITREEMVQMGITKIGSLKRLQKVVQELFTK